MTNSSAQAATEDTGQAPTNDTPQAGQAPDQHAAQSSENASGQEPKTFDADYVRTLRSESAAARKELKALRDWKSEIEDRDKSETQRAVERADAAEKRAAGLERQQAQTDVAIARGIPQFAGRLQGSTREELEADADALLKDLEIRGQAPRVPSFDAGARPNGAGAGGGSMNDLIRSAAGRP
jgi:hypothetical protein